MADHTLPPTAADEQNSSSPIAEPKSSISAEVPGKKPKLIKSAPPTEDPTRDDQILAAMESLNRRYVFVDNITSIARIPTPETPEPTLYHSSAFVNALMANKRIGSLSIAASWMRWNKRRAVERLDYIPGRPSVYANCLNTWLPSPVKPVQGDITPWTRYLDHVFKSDPTYRDWFTAWLAYPLQHPGTKLHTACVFWSTATATGKSTLGYIMSKLYGEHNFAQINEGDLGAQFNPWAGGRQFVMGEEIKGGRNAAKIADQLKSMITRQRVTINVKHTPQYSLPDYANYYFTSNHPEAFYLEQADRRFFVHELGPDRLTAEYVHGTFGPWLRNSGYEAILYHLLHEIDLKSPILGGDPHSTEPAPFNPHAAAPQTKARRAMIETSRDDLDEWLDELLDTPEEVLCGHQWTIATGPELYQLFNAAKRGMTVTYKTFCTRLRRRVPAAYANNKITLSAGRKVKLYQFAGERVTGHDGVRDLFESENHPLLGLGDE